MGITSRTSHILTATATAVVLTGVGAVAWTVNSRTPAPTIAPMASASDEGFAVSGPPGWEEECGELMAQVWGPDEAEIARITEENEAIIAILEEAGVPYELYEEPGGWSHVEPAGESEKDWRAFEEALEQYWSSAERADEDEAMWREEERERNERLAAYLDDLGIAYERHSEGDDYEYIEPVDEDGFEAMDRFWQDEERRDLEERATERGLDVAEVVDCQERERAWWDLQDQMYRFPIPMDPSMAEEHIEMVTALLAAFDEAGIDYDRIDVPIATWDLTDPAAQEIVDRVTAEYGYGDEMAFERSVSEMMVESDAVMTPEEEPKG